MLEPPFGLASCPQGTHPNQTFRQGTIGEKTMTDIRLEFELCRAMLAACSSGVVGSRHTARIIEDSR